MKATHFTSSYRTTELCIFAAIRASWVYSLDFFCHYLYRKLSGGGILLLSCLLLSCFSHYVRSFFARGSRLYKIFINSVFLDPPQFNLGMASFLGGLKFTVYPKGGSCNDWAEINSYHSVSNLNLKAKTEWLSVGVITALQKNKRKEINYHPLTSTWFLLFYSLKPWSQVRILIYQFLPQPQCDLVCFSPLSRGAKLEF